MRLSHPLGMVGSCPRDYSKLGQPQVTTIHPRQVPHQMIRVSVWGVLEVEVEWTTLVAVMMAYADAQAIQLLHHG